MMSICAAGGLSFVHAISPSTQATRATRTVKNITFSRIFTMMHMRVAVYLLLLCAATYGLPDDQDIKASIRAALEANDLDLVASLTSQLQQARSRRTVVSVRGY